MLILNCFGNLWFKDKDLRSPIDTVRKLNVHKTFKRRPGLLGRLYGCYNISSKNRKALFLET